MERKREDQSSLLPTKNFHPRISVNARPSGIFLWKPWFRHFNDHKDFHNEGTVHLFSLMALFSYANFRSNERVLNGERYMEAPGQWICKRGSLPRILRVHSKEQQGGYYEY